MVNASVRLAIFVPDLVAGGAQRSMIKLAGGLAERGYPVDLVLAHASGPFMAETPETVRLVDLGAPRVLASLPRLVDYLRRERPAAMLSVLHANLVALWARRLTGIPHRLVVSERNTLSSEVQAYATDVRMRLVPLLMRSCYPWADCVVAVSQGVAADLAECVKLPAGRIRVIYNPIITPRLRQKALEPLAHPWFTPGAPPVILAVGRLEAQKDFTTLIHAFALVRRSRLARLLILGEGDERTQLEATAQQFGVQDDVGLPGFVANPYPYMVRAGAFVLSSRWEGLPGVLIEALYCGAPLVSTDCPSGPREILAGGRYGLLTPVGDAMKLAGTIDAALNGDAPRAPQESWQPYQLETVVDQYEDALLGDLRGDGAYVRARPEPAPAEEIYAH